MTVSAQCLRLDNVGTCPILDDSNQERQSESARGGQTTREKVNATVPLDCGGELSAYPVLVFRVERHEG